MYKWIQVTTQLWRVTNVLTASSIEVIPHHYETTERMMNYVIEATA